MKIWTFCSFLWRVEEPSKLRPCRLDRRTDAFSWTLLWALDGLLLSEKVQNSIIELTLKTLQMKLILLIHPGAFLAFTRICRNESNVEALLQSVYRLQYGTTATILFPTVTAAKTVLTCLRIDHNGEKAEKDGSDRDTHTHTNLDLDLGRHKTDGLKDVRFVLWDCSWRPMSGLIPFSYCLPLNVHCGAWDYGQIYVCMSGILFIHAHD